ncbi:hypothetical protein LINPERHAP1_LOCUS36873 [Linum perenne]
MLRASWRNLCYP